MLTAPAMMKNRTWAGLGVAVIGIAACGTATPDGPSGGGCTDSAQCPSGQSCLFAVGSCSAAGQCLSLDSLGLQCGLVIGYCGCDGQEVRGLCGTDYAFGPTTGARAPCGPPPTAAPGETLTTLAQVAASEPEYVATDGKNVYVAATGTGTVFQVPVGGGPVVTLASGQDQPIGIAVYGADVYWTNEASGTKNGTVMKVPVGGGTPVAIASGVDVPFLLAVDGTNAYFTVIGSTPAVMVVPVTGGVPAVFASGTSPWAITVQGGSVYWTDSGSVFSAPTSGVGAGGPTLLAAGQSFPFSIAADASNVYWTNASGDGALLSLPRTGGTPKTLASSTGMASLAIDASNAYLSSPGTSPNDGAILRVPLAGGSATTLASGQTTPEGIAVDGSSVYWVDTYWGEVTKVSPK
jgi:hypothetical protein